MSKSAPQPAIMNTPSGGTAHERKRMSVISYTYTVTRRLGVVEDR